MPQVSIDSLTIENFGPYYGAHEFKFTSLEGRSGILIGGRNGAGKTHLLRALYLAAVGESGTGDLRKVEAGADATRFLFEKSLNRKAADEGQDTTKLSITISQRDESAGSTRKATLVREIRFRPKAPPSWRSYALKSGSTTEIEDEQVIQKLRDAFLPRHLARFFFFDAERSQSINLGQQDIVEGVSRILGLWTYGELENDLRSLIQAKIPKVYSSSAAAEAAGRLADLSADVLRAEGHLKAKRKEVGTLELELHEVEAELGEVEDSLKGLGAVDPEEMLRSQQRRNEIAEAKIQMETQLTTAWEVAMPVAMLGAYRKDLHDDLVQEEERRGWEGKKAAVEPKIPQVKQDVFEAVPKEFALKSDVHAFYSARLEQALHRLFYPPPEVMLQVSPYMVDRNDVSVQVRMRLARATEPLKGLAELCVNLERMEAELRETDQRLKQLQQNSAAITRGGELHNRRGELTTRQEQIKRRLEELRIEIARLEAEATELKREEVNQREITEKAEKGQSLAALAARYREAAADIKSRAAIQLRKSIAEHVGDLWVEITERGREFTGMDFDKDWNCFLVRRDGKKVSWEDTNTSAGQRQVRMLAFYEALRRLAKLVPPLVVDTPLARLDKEVRESVLNRLYLSGHQSIILTTNAEIDPEGPLFESVQDRLARVYTLNPHGETNSPDYEVRISTDYFGHSL